MNTSDEFSAKSSFSKIELTVGKKIYAFFKRLLDLFFSVLFIVAALIPGIIIAVTIKLTDNGTVFFIQNRVGRFGKQFKCYKFRTMSPEAPCNCATAELVDAERYITKVGRVLRKSSLDEIPQLINIVKGDMSFIGPRPLIPKEEQIHTARKDLGIYSIRPGLSGMAQVNGRDSISADEKVAYDYLYLQKFGIVTDISLLFKTIFRVLREENVVEGAIEPSCITEQTINTEESSNTEQSLHQEEDLQEEAQQENQNDLSVVNDEQNNIIPCPKPLTDAEAE